jgi:hypothetical protein
MIKIIVEKREITSCRGRGLTGACPHLQWDQENDWYCIAKMKQEPDTIWNIPHKTVMNGFPEWCPLDSVEN